LANNGPNVNTHRLTVSKETSNPLSASNLRHRGAYRGNETALDVERVLDCGMDGQEPLR
jgi:hypothetical protein